jgi:hypothetical protein
MFYLVRKCKLNNMNEIETYDYLQNKLVERNNLGFEISFSEALQEIENEQDRN